MSPARPTKGEPREAGRELDAEIAEKVFGLKVMQANDENCAVMEGYRRGEWLLDEDVNPASYELVRYYSTDIAAAWLVVEHFRNSKDDDLRIRSGKVFREVFTIAHNYTAAQVSAAICRGALEIVTAQP